MKKGQRPSRHYRRVKTKKGRKKILVNKSIKKKSNPIKRKMRSKSEIDLVKLMLEKAKDKRQTKANKINYDPSIKDLTFEQVKNQTLRKRFGINKNLTLEDRKRLMDPEITEDEILLMAKTEARQIKKDLLKEAGIDEIKRRIKQQLTMNMLSDIDKKKSVPLEMPIEDSRSTREKELEFLQSKPLGQVKRDANKKMTELMRLGAELKRQKDPATVVDFVNQRFSKGNNIDDKIEKAILLAEASGDPRLITQAEVIKDEIYDKFQKANDALNAEILQKGINKRNFDRDVERRLQELQSNLKKEESKSEYNTNQMTPAQKRDWELGLKMLAMPQSGPLPDIEEIKKEKIDPQKLRADIMKSTRKLSKEVRREFKSRTGREI